MPVATGKKGTLTVKAYPGDAKTLLSFDLDKKSAKGLAGFTIQCTPKGHTPYYLFNTLQFEHPADHAQDSSQPPTASINAPIHAFRWIHVPGSMHQGTTPFMGKYTYTITPRYFDAGKHLLPLDQKLSAAVDVDVTPFRSAGLKLGFTRGYAQSQAFVRHFGKDTRIVPLKKELLFDTSKVAGTNANGESSTYADIYRWMGSTARARVFEILDEVRTDPSLSLDVFAYDLNEPDMVQAFLALAKQGRMRLVLDSAGLHHDKAMSKPEDKVEQLFRKAMKGAAGIIRGRFGNFAHDKVMIVRSKATGAARRVLTGSTNFSVTGMYVNSNHVLVFDDAEVARLYARKFDAVWKAGKTEAAKFRASDLGPQHFAFKSAKTPPTDITFAPHEQTFALKLMSEVAARVGKEKSQGKTTGSVLFAVMDLATGGGPVRPALTTLHAKQAIFSYGIADSKKGIRFYQRGTKQGVLVTGKPGVTMLPEPFNQVPQVGGHQIHHKFVICGFNTPKAMVYCGSSNLADGGEFKNGDNLLAISDRDVATAFAIEAFLLVDHFNFLGHYAAKKGVAKGKAKAPASKPAAAAKVKWFLTTGDGWTTPFYDSSDLKSVDRQLFA